MTENQGETPRDPQTVPIPGSRVGSYRILSFLGRGGMGVVYLAERADQEYRQRAAVKVAYSSHGEGLSRRFRSERQILAQLSHPYIAKLLDGGSTADGHPYFVMDYIEGLPIDEHCDAHRLTIEERLNLFRKVCSAVQYAHQKRVVHRDIKPANILVTEDGVPQLLDFGIAKLLDPTAFPMTVEATVTQQLPMTPSYASPEQILGHPVTERSDVYSLGALLYRLLTGHLPYRLLGLSQHEIVHLVSKTGPLKPSLLIERAGRGAAKLGEQRGLRPQELRRRLSGELDNITMTALAREPEQRYGSVEELSEDVLRYLERRPVRARPRGWAYRLRRQLRRYRTPIAATALALTAVAGAYVLGTSRAPGGGEAARQAESPAVDRRLSVAVLDLLGRPSDDGDTAWISTALSDMVGVELGAGEQLRVLPGALVSRMSEDLALPADQPLPKEALSKVHDYLGADRLVFGTYVATPPKIRVEIGLQDAVSGRSLGTWVESGSLASLSDLAMRLGERLREGLDVSLPANVDPATALSSHPVELEAARLYAEGLRRMWLFDFPAARDVLEETVQLEPRSAVAHAALATAYKELGNDRRAAETAHMAWELAGNLPREKRLLLQGQALEAAMDWAGAAEIYRALSIVFPDSPEHLLRLAEVETLGGQPAQALQTLADLRRRSGGRSDPRIDLAEARACQSRSDLNRQHEAAVRAAELGQRLGAEQLVATAHLLEAEALHSMGRYAEAAEAVGKAREIFTRRGDRRGLAEALLSQQDPRYADWRGDLGISYDDAVEIFRELGDRRGEARALVRLARRRIYEADPEVPSADIEDQLLAALNLAREVGSHRAEAEALNYLGVFAFAADRPLEESLDWFEQALAAAQESGDRRLVAGFLMNIGNILVGLEKYQDGLERFDRAITLAREIDSRYVLGLALAVSDRTLLRTGQLRTAVERSRESLAIARETQNQRLLEMSLDGDAMLAAHLGDRRLFLERSNELERLLQLWGRDKNLASFRSIAWMHLGRPDKAELFARELLAMPGFEDDGRLRLSAAFVAQGKLTEARKALGPLFDETPQEFLVEERDGLLRLVAILEAAEGRGEGARRRLEEHIAKSEKVGNVLSAFESRLTLGRVLLLTGKAEEAENLLVELADAAGVLGYESIRQRALELANGSPDNGIGRSQPGGGGGGGGGGGTGAAALRLRTTSQATSATEAPRSEIPRSGR